MIGIFLYATFSPLIWPLIRVFLYAIPKMRLRFKDEMPIRREALKIISQVKRSKTVLLFHAASAGEFEQLKPLLSRIDRQRFTVLQTFSSPTIYLKEKSSALFDAVCYHPSDSILSAFLFFRAVRPGLYVVNRHDLWPSHIIAARFLGIPTALINANIHARSLRCYFPFRGVNRALFEMTGRILCGSVRIQEKILCLAPGAVTAVTGDSRSDQVLLRRECNKKDHFSSPVSDRKNILLGSLIPSDYNPVLGGIREFFSKLDKLVKHETHDSYRIIAIPHEVTEQDIALLTAALEKHGFSWKRYSEDTSAGSTDVYIVDTVGILADLYCYAYCAYVGAGFGAGVHSVVEPAVYGVPVFYGPHYQILDEAVSMAEQEVSVIVKCAKDVCRYLEDISDPIRHQFYSEASRRFVESTETASERILSELTKLLEQQPHSAHAESL